MGCLDLPEEVQMCGVRVDNLEAIWEMNWDDLSEDEVENWTFLATRIKNKMGVDWKFMYEAQQKGSDIYSVLTAWSNRSCKFFKDDRYTSQEMKLTSKITTGEVEIDYGED
jgi:hypothetical protein